MKDAVELKVSGLKCDNPDCDFVDMSIDVKDYKKWIGAKCPKCGEILLTEADYRNVKFLMGVVNLANRIFPKRKDDEEVCDLSVKMDGSGKMDFEFKNNNEHLD